ncbi:DUF2281 domain-containing protein [Gammaproteobacteria bacterium]
MNFQEAITLLEHLPSDKQSEIFDYIEFISLRTLKQPVANERHPLENEPFYGLWKDREEMKDSVAYVRQLRQKEWKRHD